jgi:hypothetical protein
MEDVSLVITVGVPSAAAVAWLVTLHSRVRAHSEQLLEIKVDIRYVRERIDRALNN